MSVYNKISAGFKIGSVDPITSGIEDMLFLGNKSEWQFIYDPNNPLVIIAIRPIGGAQLWQYTGANNSFSTLSKSATTAVGPRYSEEVDFNIAGNSSTIKQIIDNGGYSRLFAIAINNYKSGDSGIELYGAVCGLIFSDAERNSTDENLEGGYKLKLVQPPKLREPLPPRSISIPVSPVGVSGSVPTVGTARQATLVPTGVTATPSETGGSLPAGTYYGKIVSVDAQGTTIGSSEVSGVIAGSTGQVTYAWTAAPGATSYRVYIGTSAAGENKYYTTSSLNFVYSSTGQSGSTAGSVPGSGTAYTALATPSGQTATATAGGGLANGTWYYKVTALDAVGETVGSGEVSATTSGSNNAVTVAWTAVPGAVSYNVYRGSAASGENIFFNTTAVSFVDNGVNLPATYQNTLNVIQGFVGNP